MFLCCNIGELSPSKLCTISKALFSKIQIFMKTSNLHSSHWNTVVSWLQPSVNNSKQLKQVQTPTQSRLKPRGHLRNGNFAVSAERRNVPKMDTITNITKTTCLQLPKSHDLPQYTMVPLPLWALGVKFPNVSPLAFMWGSGTITYKAFCRFIRAMPFHQSSSLLCLQSVRSHRRAL